MTTLEPKAAFLHVIDSHRWLAASGCAWNLVGQHATSGTKTEAERLLPDVEVMIRDCLLLHARSLVKFYKNVSHRNTDILLSDFGFLAPNTSLTRRLEDFDQAIEVHLLHLTDWRDFDYRSLHATGRNAKRNRPDWNRDASLIVELIFETLDHISGQSGPWQQPFKALHAACTSRYQDKSFPWPTQLSEKSDVEHYLKSIGL